MGVLDDIKEQYPQLAWLVNDPEVGKLLRDAVDPNKGFSPQTFQAKLYKTKWFRTRSTSQREMSILKNTDPAEYRRWVMTAAAGVSDLSTRMGHNLSRNKAAYLATTFVDRGIEIGSPEFMQQMRGYMRAQSSGGFEAAGSVDAAATQFRQIARNQYYLPVDNAEAHRWGIELALGIKDENAVKELMNQRAQSRYPHLRELLASGNSMEEIFSGHRAMIAQELEISPATIDFTREWSKVLHQVDPQTGNPRPMTLHEAATLARQDQRWWSTSNGRAKDAGMTNLLLKTFGKRA